jgi:DNA polymerase III subunit beta
MKFSVALPEFQRLLQTALQAIPPKSTVPVLENFHFVVQGNALQIVATDQELTILATLNVSDTSDGEVLVPARKLVDIVKALGNAGVITLSSDARSHKITLKTSFGEYVLHGLDASEFPTTPDLSTGTTLTLAAEDAMKIARTASFAASRDEYRPAMTGLLLQATEQQLNAVTTDGFRLVRVIVRSSDASIASQPIDVIIPVRAVDLLKKIDATIEILISPTHAKFITGSTTIITRVIDERFPPYESVIPQDNDKEARFAIADLSGAVKRVSLFANPNTKQIRFALSKNSIKVAAEDVETGNKGHEEFVCDYGGADLEIGFNYRYIEEAISHLSDNGASTAMMTFSSANRAALIKPIKDDAAQNDVLMLVMPVRL